MSFSQKPKKFMENLENEVLIRKKRYSPFYFKSLDFKDDAFEKERDQEEKSFQLRKNTDFNNGIRLGWFML